MLDEVDLSILDQLTGNIAPSRFPLNALKQCQIKLLESHVRSQIEAEKKNIEALKIQLKAAEEAQDRRSEKLQDLRRAVISWADFPAEILSQIFRHLKEPIHFPVRRSNIIWTILQVCSRWRQVALDEPALWVNVRSNFSPTHQDEAAQAVLANILARSGNRSISLSVSCDLLRWDNTNIGIPFFTAIGTAVRRVSSLSLREFSTEALHKLRTTLERLELPLFPSASKLEMFTTGSYKWLFNVCPVSDLILHMPNVSRLILSGDPQCIGHSFYEFNLYPWTQFQEITLLKYELPIDDALDVLRQASQLHSVKLQIVGTHEGGTGIVWNPTPCTVQLPYLEEVDMILDTASGAPADAAIKALFVPLATPRLKRLSISAIKISGRYDILDLEEDEPDHVMGYLCTLKSLTSLHLEGCINVDIDRLLVELPGLQDLTVHPAESNQLSKQSMLALASQQCGVNLRSLHCLVAEEDVEVFVSALTDQWTRCCGEGPRSLGCLHHAVISAGCRAERLIAFNESIQDLRKQLGVEFSAHFVSLHDPILTGPASDSDFDQDFE